MQPDMTAQSLFFRLPRELRDHIYSLLDKPEEDIFVKVTPRRVFDSQYLVATSSALIGASRTVNSEVYSALQEHTFRSAGKIIAIVTDLDFRAVIKFVKSLTPNQIAILHSASGPSLVIEGNNVRITYKFGAVTDPDTCAERLQRIECALPDVGEVKQFVDTFMSWLARREARARMTGTAGMLG
ncbi:hypothetical protein LTR85_003640 [Meristemomyces frigidus]|nr:hypothetical protein LTR85_003640 [Meristemomyces frigidus]